MNGMRVAFLSAALLPFAAAATNVSPPAEQGRITGNHDEIITTSSTFLEGHPDVRHRNSGNTALRGGFHEDAAMHFRKAASFADKPSQAVYAEMLWDGIGMGQDRALAYAWMDLAAERGNALLVAKREQYWAALGEAERARALQVGKDVYARYGDEVAQPRQEEVMRKARRNVTGSRVGFVGPLRIRLPGPGGGFDGAGYEVSGDQMYARELWEPAEYWAWQDAVTDRTLRAFIRIGDLEQEPAPDVGSGHRIRRRN